MQKEKIKQLIRYKEIREWYERNERLLIPAALVLGVVADFATFTSISIVTSFILLGAYFVVAGAAIIFLNIPEAGDGQKAGNLLRYLRIVAPLALQFTFGALLSGSFIFYIFSGTLFVSWPFIAAIVILMISNEVFRHYYLHPPVQMGVYFFILFTLVSILLPFALSTISAAVFIVSGAASLAVFIIFFALARRSAPKLKAHSAGVALAVAVVFIFVNGLYFLNIIPPIPLAIRGAELAHDIKRVNGNYELLAEEEPFLSRLMPGKVFHKKEGERVYVFTSIFAPKGLETRIVHRWQYYDEAQKQWVIRDKLSFEISGGTKTGYRGYSFKSQVTPGRWRVNVETERGQALGRINFSVLESAEEPKLKVLIK